MQKSILEFVAVYGRKGKVEGEKKKMRKEK